MGCNSVTECMLSMLQALGAIPSTKKQERAHEQVIWKVSSSGSRVWKELETCLGQGSSGAIHRRE